MPFFANLFFYDCKFYELVVSVPIWPIIYFRDCRTPRSHRPRFEFFSYSLGLPYLHGPRFSGVIYLVFGICRASLRAYMVHPSRGATLLYIGIVGLRTSQFTLHAKLIFIYWEFPRSAFADSLICARSFRYFMQMCQNRFFFILHAHY